jgi:hypothetical protein
MTDRDTIVQLLQDGLSAYQIAKRMDKDPGYINRIVRDVRLGEDIGTLLTVLITNADSIELSDEIMIVMDRLDSVAQKLMGGQPQ